VCLFVERTTGLEPATLTLAKKGEARILLISAFTRFSACLKLGHADPAFTPFRYVGVRRGATQRQPG
jgi:hypothetical protein